MVPMALDPGEAVGPFGLGDSLWQVLDYLRTNKTDYPKLDISWDPDNAPRSAVTIHLAEVTLFFPSPLQRLGLIRVSLASSTLTLTYQSDVLTSPRLPLTRAKVARALGPTYASSSASTKLAYPGIAFDFAPASKEREDVVEAITVTPREEIEADTYVITPGQGVEVDGMNFEIGVATEQDLLLDLGAPLRKFYKVDDRLARMWGGDETDGCFWNYFELGLDFFIVNGVVQKIIAHSNIPGTPLFQQYARCPWTIPVGSGVLDMTSPLDSFRSHFASGSSYDSNEGGAPDAMVLDRAVDGGLDGVIGVSPSRLTGFEGLIVEEDQKSGGICSVLVYKK